MLSSFGGATSKMGCKFKPVMRGLDFLEPAKLMASVR